MRQTQNDVDYDGTTSGVAEATGARAQASGKIESMLMSYSSSSDRLLGYLLDVGFDEMTLVTCDAWKLKCGGVPKNSFVIVKLKADAAAQWKATAGEKPTTFLIMARITETAPTPVSADIQSTIFQMHKVQARVDPLTNAELQWGALKARILGTYYDDAADAVEGSRIEFGNDIDGFLSPHFYEVFVPTDDHLDVLVNSFVDSDHPIEIGRLRYSETQTICQARDVSIRVAPDDFIANRTALFAKTRHGKSNIVKVVLDMMLSRTRNVGQIVLDLSGEYTYPDPQTGVSIYLSHRSRCIRYSLRPRRPDAERKANVPPPAMLRTNFYTQVRLGHATIVSLYDSIQRSRRPDYMAPFFAWEPVDAAEIRERFPEIGEQRRYRRAMSMYLALLHEAGYPGGDGVFVDLELHEPIRQRLATDPIVQKIASVEVNADGIAQVTDRQKLPVAVRLYERLWQIYDLAFGDSKLFPVSSSSGKPYLEGIHRCLLQMLGDSGISGPKKLTPFVEYHDPSGTDIVRAIVKDVDHGKTVLIDFGGVTGTVPQFYTELITQAVFDRQMEKFSVLERLQFERQSVLFYFEEAHNLFRADDKDLSSIYNKLAKEGAKFRIGMVFATQSVTTLSPDLLKNSENFFIGHLNDDREIREVERRYEFSGIGLDVQRARTKGYVWMITLSHRYALPVQIKLFKAAPVADDFTPQAELANQEE